MTREELKELGLTDEQIEKVMASHGKALNAVKDKADKVETLESQVEDYKTQLADRDKQLKDLGEKAKGNEELTAQIDELKQQNEATKTEYEEKLQKQSFDHVLEKSLTGAKVKNVKAVRALLDMEMIKLDGDTLKGLDEQVTKLKETDAYLFESEDDKTKPPKIVTPGNPDGGDNTGDDPFAAKLAKYK